jgi:hypothetical protein
VNSAQEKRECKKSTTNTGQAPTSMGICGFDLDGVIVKQDDTGTGSYSMIIPEESVLSRYLSFHGGSNKETSLIRKGAGR